MNKVPARAASAALLIVVSVLSLALQANPLTDDSAKERASVLQVLNDEDAAWAKGDANAFAAHVSEDVIFTNVVGMFSVGKTPFIAQHTAIFATIYQHSSLHQYLQNIALIKPDTAVIDTVCTVRGFKELPPGVSAVDGLLYTRLEQVMVKKNNSWEVASFHNVPIQQKFVDEGVKSLTSKEHFK